MARFVYMILDGVGAGALPDAADFGDEGSDTLGNLAALVDLEVPTLAALGLGNLHPLRGVPPARRPLALPGRLAEQSAGKDTTNGHWEHMGLVTATPFPTYPAGFPEEVLAPYRERIGRDVLGNKAASGTEIIAELGEQHLATGRPIVYTSADSVFQVAAHVDVIPLEELYRYCDIAREILTGKHAVARVIARPFTGPPGAFARTKDRKDFSLAPPGTTYLDLLSERGIPVVGLGKIHQIFAGRGVSEELKVGSNDENLALLLALLEEGRPGLLFTNLVDFDMAWGHRNDVEGFAAGLAAVDRALPAVLDLLGPDDRLLITADHGVDPTTVSTDHSREYAPLLYYPRPAGTPDASYEGLMWDTGATVFARLTGEEPHLGGRALEQLRPERGWRPYPTVPACRPAEPCAVGRVQAEEAAQVLRKRFGPAPAIAVVLGSGLDGLADLGVESEGIGYDEIPGWRSGAVAGHRGRLDLGVLGGRRVAFLRGRLHGYEGADLGEQQLAVRTLARWGVRTVVLTNASGALDTGLPAGTVALVGRILDFQSPRPDGTPDRLDLTTAVGGPRADGSPVESETRVVSYAALPGPQYETPAEVAVLHSLGAQVVGMSAAAEARAAAEEALEVLVVTVVTNAAAETAVGGEAAHSQVVDVSGASVRVVHRLLEHLLRECPTDEGPPA